MNRIVNLRALKSGVLLMARRSVNIGMVVRRSIVAAIIGCVSNTSLLESCFLCFVVIVLDKYVTVDSVRTLWTWSFKKHLGVSMGL